MLFVLMVVSTVIATILVIIWAILFFKYKDAYEGLLSEVEGKGYILKDLYFVGLGCIEKYEKLTNKKITSSSKAAKKMKDCKQIHVSFTITKNVTDTNGNRTVYVRIQTPNGDILSGGMFDYEDRKIEYSMKKTIEYGGEEVSVSTYWNVNEFLSPGEYRVSVFSDGHMIGSRTFSFN